MKNFRQHKDSSTTNRRSRNSSERQTVGRLGRLLGLLFLVVLSGFMITNLFGLSSSQELVTSYQTIAHEFSSGGLLIRDEAVTSAPQAAKLSREVEEGTRVKVGEEIVTLEENDYTKQLYNYQAGLLSYQLDGLEDKLQPANRDQLTYDDFMDLESNPTSISSGDRVEFGQPVFRIINNFTSYLAVLLPQEQLSEYETGQQIEVIFPELEETRPFSGEIDQIISDKPENIMLIELKKFIPELIKERRLEVEIIKARYNGIVVPKQAIARNPDGETAVKVSGQISNHFKEVDVVQKVEDQVIIDGVLPGVEILID